MNSYKISHVILLPLPDLPWLAQTRRSQRPLCRRTTCKYAVALLPLPCETSPAPLASHLCSPRRPFTHPQPFHSIVETPHHLANHLHPAFKCTKNLPGRPLFSTALPTTQPNPDLRISRHLLARV